MDNWVITSARFSLCLLPEVKNERKRGLQEGTTNHQSHNSRDTDGSTSGRHLRYLASTSSMSKQNQRSKTILTLHSFSQSISYFMTRNFYITKFGIYCKANSHLRSIQVRISYVFYLFFKSMTENGLIFSIICYPFAITGIKIIKRKLTL